MRREQTEGRNLTSNTLKLFLREARTDHSLVSASLEKNNDQQKVFSSPKEFIKILNKHLPPKKNYVSLGEVKELIEGKKVGKTFGKVLRTSLVDFYQQRIHSLEIKSARTSKEIRSQQVKKGEEIIVELDALDL